MTEVLLKEIIEKIEDIPSIKDVGDFSIFYRNLPDKKASLYLMSFQKLRNAVCLGESYDLGKKEIEKGALMFLAALNILFQENPGNDELRNIMETLRHIHTLGQEELRNKILLGFLCVGITLFKNFAHELDVLSEKIIIGEFHNIGGFQPDMWGVSVNFDLFPDLINSLKGLSEIKLSKLRAYYKYLRVEEFSMIPKLLT